MPKPNEIPETRLLIPAGDEPLTVRSMLKGVLVNGLTGAGKTTATRARRRRIQPGAPATSATKGSPWHIVTTFSTARY